MVSRGIAFVLIFLLAFAANLNAAIGHRYTFKVGDKVDLKMFMVHDSVWSDSGENFFHDHFHPQYLQRKFTVDTMEVNTVTHAKVEVYIERLIVPDSGKKTGDFESAGEVYITGSGRLLWATNGSGPYFVGAEGFDDWYEYWPRTVPINATQNAVFIQVGDLPDAPTVTKKCFPSYMGPFR
jgi:hypothetical protein